MLVYKQYCYGHYIQVKVGLNLINNMLIKLSATIKIINNFRLNEKIIKNSLKSTFKINTTMKKVSKETRREQRYNANLHNIFVKAQREITYLDSLYNTQL